MESLDPEDLEDELPELDDEPESELELPPLLLPLLGIVLATASPPSCSKGFKQSKFTKTCWSHLVSVTHVHEPLQNHYNGAGQASQGSRAQGLGGDLQKRQKGGLHATKCLCCA